MNTNRIERWWQRAIVVTFALAIIAFFTMLFSGHDQGYHDTEFGLLLFLVLFLSAALCALLFALYLIYVLVNWLHAR